MQWKKSVTVCCAFALTAFSVALGQAETDSRARAEVFSRQISGHARLVFSWDSRETVPFTIENEGDRVILHFEEPVALRWDASLKVMQPFIKEVESRDDGDTVVLTLKKPATARHFRNLTPENTDSETGKSVIDLVEAPAARESMENQESEPSPRHEALIAHPRHREPKAKRLAKAKHTYKIYAQQEVKKLADLAPAAGTPTAPAHPVASTPIKAQPAATAESVAPPASPSIPVHPSPAPPTPASPPLVMETPAATAPKAPETMAITLPLKDDDGLAAFVWQKRLWLVTKAPLSVDDLRKAAPFAADIRALPNPDAAILSMPLKDGLNVSIDKTPSDHLRIVLGQGPAQLSQNIAPVLDDAKGKASLSLDAGKARQNIAFTNPLTGDRLNVIPLPEPGAGVSVPHDFVEFNLLRSAQGIAVQSLSDAVSVTLDKGKAIVSAPDGLAISPQAAQQLKEEETDALLAHAPAVLFPYARWKLEDEKTFVPTEMKFFDAIVENTGDDAQKARLKLLGLYLGEGMFAEALGLSNDILRNGLGFYREHKVAALRGAAYFFLYRIQEAERDFSAPELAGDPEAVMMRSLCRELLAEGKETFDYTGNYERYIRHYPPVFIQKLAIIAADRLTGRKEYDAANNVLEQLKRDNYDEPVRKYVDYMRAKILSETHDEAEAAKIWEEQAKDLDDPLIRARADFSLINMQIKNGNITHEQAESRLDRLRIVWRGDSVELSVLGLLGRLYTQDKQYAKALHTMRDIVLYYPQVPEALSTAEQMEGIFVLLYNKGGADAMPPLEALSLFYEFRDLLPIGKDGDLMIRNLADRLVSIDLLDRAALLLDHQVRNRLVGEDRSRLAAKLAHIYLLNHQPEEALDTLKTTGYGDLPADLQMERIRLTAQALAQQGKTAQAIDVLRNDNSTEGELLRLSIYWGGKDWPNVTSMAEDILGNRTDPSAPLTAQESDVLLKLATAYVYQHDTGQLQYLRDYFTPLMKKNRNRDSFLFITSESGNIDYDNLANLDQDINTVKSFLAKSENKPGKDGFSKATN